MSDNNRDFKVLDDRQHVLLRPGMYIGSITPTEREQWVYSKDDNKFCYATVKYVPALLKCASELVDNAIDVAIDTNFSKATKIKVNVDDVSIEVIDDGIGIPCAPPKGSTSTKPEDTCACVAWTTLKSGTSFGDDRKKIGTNGVGSSCVNIFSKKFIGESDDGVHYQKIKCTDNMSTISAGDVKPSSGKSGVKVYCEPDLERFGLAMIDQMHKDLIYQRLVTLSICYPKINFYFNGSRINVNSKKFAAMFSDNAEIVSTDNATVIVFPNAHDDFKFYSAVNGVDTCRGGQHVENVTYEICNRVRDKLIKKWKSIRPGDVKNKIALALFLTDFKNPQFDSQTKESLSNANADVLAHFDGQIDWDKFVKQILHNDAIIDPIIETFKIKEELKARQELKRVKKIKVASDKYMSPIGSKKYLFLCEGQSAASSLGSCLGRKGNGFYSLRGLPINCVANSIHRIAANQEFKDVMNLLGLDITQSPDANVNIDFDKVIIACDQDLDGNHLSSMLIGWFKRFAPKLFNLGKICKLQTPLIIIKNKKDTITHYFFNLDDFKKWETTNKDKSLKIIYQKGLGSFDRSDIDWLMANNGGVEYFLYELHEDVDAFKNADVWLLNDAEPRKVKLRSYVFDIDKA